jgi:phage-related protein
MEREDKLNSRNKIRNIHQLSFYNEFDYFYSLTIVSKSLISINTN